MFPTTLANYHVLNFRLLVHEIAEELGLGHKSVGEEKDRRIVLERRLGLFTINNFFTIKDVLYRHTINVCVYEF